MTPWLLPVTAASLWFGILSRTPLALVALALLAAVAGWIVARTATVCRILLIVAVGCGIGSFWGGVRADALSHGPLARADSQDVLIQGALRSDPEVSAIGWHALVHTSLVSRAPDAAVRATEAVWISGNGPPPVASRGDQIQATGVIEVPPDEGFMTYLRSIGVGSTLRVATFVRLGPPSDPVLRVADHLRRQLRERFSALFPEREAGLLMGLALGDRGNIDAGITRDFQATGLTHLLAVSGGNLAMVLAPALAVLAMIGAAPVIRISFGVGLVIFFVLLTGAEPSVLRAGVMALLTLGAMAMGRPRAAWPILGGAVLALLILDPFLAGSVGFQLSVGATAGIITFASKIAERLSWCPRPISLALGTTLGAQLGVGPLLLYYFHWLSVTSLVANVLAFPLVEPAMLLGLLAAGVSAVVPLIGGALAWIDFALLRALVWLADAMATAPVPALTSSGGPVFLAVSTACVVGLAVWLHGGYRIPRRAVGCIVLIAPIVLWSNGLGAGPPTGLTIRFLDVGQGDAALVTSPAGASILIDAGPDPDAVAVRLAQLGVRRLDAVVATHQHADHVEGLPQVLARLPVGLVLEPGCQEDSSPYEAFEEAVDAEHLARRFPRTGDVIDVGDIHMEVLSPSGCFQGTNSDPNNDSIVFRLSVAEDSVLFTGDAEVEAQQEMLELDPAKLHTSVLKVPHHGGDTSADGFFDAVAPEYAIISVGSDNDYGHPVDSVVDDLEAAGAEVLRTDQLGEIIIRFDPSEPEGVVVASEPS